MKSASKLEKVSFWFYAAGLFTCTWDLLLKAEVGGFHLKFYEPMFLLGFLTLAAANYKRGADFFLPLRAPFAIAMLCLAGFYMGVSPWSAFPIKSFLYSAWLVFDVLAIWLAGQHLARVIPLRNFHLVLWSAMLLLSAIILIDNTAYHLGRRQGLIGYNQDFYTNLGVSRPHGFTNEPSFAAAFLCLGLFTIGIPMISSSRRRWLTGLGAGITVLALIVTTSRMGWISLAYGCLLYFFLPALGGRKVKWKAFGVLALAVPVLAGVFYVATPSAQIDVLKEKFIGSVFHGNDSSGNSRLQAYKLGYQMAVDTKGLGSGLGASYKYYRDHGGSDSSQIDAFNPHYYGSELIMSTWGQLMAEGGVAALLLFLLAAFFLCRDLYRRWKHDDSPATLGALTASIVFLSFMAFWMGNLSRGDIWIWYALWSAQTNRHPL
jgi:O-antigen ligase